MTTISFQVESVNSSMCPLSGKWTYGIYKDTYLPNGHARQYKIFRPPPQWVLATPAKHKQCLQHHITVLPQMEIQSYDPSYEFRTMHCYTSHVATVLRSYHIEGAINSMSYQEICWKCLLQESTDKKVAALRRPWKEMKTYKFCLTTGFFEGNVAYMSSYRYPVISAQIKKEIATIFPSYLMDESRVRHNCGSAAQATSTYETMGSCSDQ